MWQVLTQTHTHETPTIVRKQTHLILPKDSPLIVLPSYTPHLTPIIPRQPLLSFLSKLIYIFLEFHINGTI